MSEEIIDHNAGFAALQRVIEYSREEAARLGLDTVCAILEMAKSAVEDARGEPHEMGLHNSRCLSDVRPFKTLKH